MDGTFRKVPDAFLQLYTVHGLIDGKFKPFLFALMTRKTRMLYECLLRMIHALVPKLRPLTVSIDFEMGMISAVKEVISGKIKFQFHL